MFPAQVSRPEIRERPCKLNFPFVANLEYTLCFRDGTSQTGKGVTENVSSRRIVFRADRELAVGVALRLSVRWPVRLNERASLKLIISGRVIRAQGNRVTVQFSWHEFHTAGGKASPGD